ncbi:1-acyl-sn-glycerol-3-phosphate acyltransferase [Candidatus Gracilibacteria bacterium]|nr:1-acyl-sn-glycerol-3-phosphate acyltransferase [Candidatus Gracilibacteria bacterium]
MVEQFDIHTLERQKEIERVNTITRKYWGMVMTDPSGAREAVRQMCEEIFDEERITTNITGLDHIPPNQGPYIFAPNHPTVLEEHKIFEMFGAKYSVPYYILLFDHLMSQHLEKPVHFVVTGPDNDQYRKVHESLGYILVPHRPNGEKLSIPEMKTINTQVQAYLNKGESIVIFPEGKFYGKGNIGPLQPGTFHLAEKFGAPVTPVLMDGFDEPYSHISFDIAAPKEVPAGLHPRDAATIFRCRIIEELGLRPVETRET